MVSSKVCLVLLCFIRSGSAQLLECSADSDCIPAEATCPENLCKCPNDMVFNVFGSMCLPVSVGYGASCTETNQCGWLSGAYECIDNKCGCADGWVYYLGNCVKRGAVNQICAADGDCFNGYDVLAMTCDGNKCVCSDGYYLRGNYDCRPAVTELDDYCSLDSDCKVDNSVCLNSFCTTAPSSGRNVSFELDNVSVVAKGEGEGTDIGTICTKSDDCLIPNSMCYLHFKKCFCKRGYSYVSDKCIAELGVASGCAGDQDCISTIPYSRCVNGACYCRKTYFTLPGNMGCQKPMTHDNLFCNTPQRCYVLGLETVCEENLCKCLSGIDPTADFVCEPALDCSTTSDCDAIINSVCDSGICACPENYRMEGSVCLPNLGAACHDQAPCTLENASCGTDKMCSCDEKFVPNENEVICLPVVEALNATCEVNEQCAVTVPNSECVESECKCHYGYGEIDGACIFIRKMGDPCSDLKDCDAFLGSNVLCRNGICGCPANMKINVKKNDCESSAGLLSVSYFTAILLVTISILL